MIKFSFIGAGSYGTAVAHHFAAREGYEVLLYGRDPEVVEEINAFHRNHRYLGDHPLSLNLRATGFLEQACARTPFIFLAVPAQSLRLLVHRISPHLEPGTTLISLAKGIEVDSLKRMSQVIHDVLSERHGSGPVMSLSGPSFAGDVVDPHKSVALSLGGKSRRHLKNVRQLLHSPSFRVFGCRDLAGVEWGGALKNVFALMAGIMRGAGEGDSYLGEYVPRALVEIDTIKRYFGARRDTSRAVSSLGDLIITCSDASRNFRFGRAYAENYPKAASGEAAVDMAFEAVGSRTVEGYHTLKAIHWFVEQKKMFAPIIRELYDILYAGEITGKSPSDAIASFRKADSLRTWENLRTYSRILSSLFPRIWYRRF